MNDSKAVLNSPDWERWVRQGFPRGFLVRTTSTPNGEHLPPNQALELTRVWSDGRADVVFRGLAKQLQRGEWEFIKPEVARGRS